MAEETKTTAAPETPPPAAAEVPVSTVPAPETAEVPAVESSEAPAAAEEKVDESDAAAAEIVKEEKITESASFKEESNVVAELPDPEKKAIEELKELVRQALIKHEFTAPPPPPAPIATEEEKKPETESKPEEEKKETEAESKPEEEKIEEKKEPVVEETKPEEEKKEAETPPVADTPPPAAEPSETATAVVVEETVEKKEETTTVEEVKETIVEDASPPPAEEAAPPPPAEEANPPAVEKPAPVTPEEVSIWGIPLLADERSDTIFLKFLRARDFKVKEAFLMLKNVVAWRKEFGIETLLEEEETVTGWEKVVFMDGVDKEGHPVCYNAYGEFQDKELYQSAFGDAEKQSKFLKWRILFLEKSIRKLDFSPDGISTVVQVNDLKNSPGLYLFKKELRQATNQALQLLQDNYPEFVAKQVFINVPWWYVTYNRMISPFLTARTKSKFVFAGPSKTAEVLFKYIAPEHVPIQYGGLSKEGEQEFSSADSATEDTIKPSSKHTIEFPVTEPSTLVWEARVLGWEVAYSAEFVPTAEGSYTVIVQKARKIGPADEPVVAGSYKVVEAGKVVVTFDNQASKKKKLLYRFKTKASE